MLEGPSSLRIEVGTAFSNRRVPVSLKWTPTTQDIGHHLVVLEASDGQGTDRLQFHIVVKSKTDAPIANAGFDRTTPPGEVLLDGSKSLDAQGSTEGLAYSWRLVQGPAKVDFADAKRAQTQVILRAPGAYIFELIVSKDGKQSAPALVRVSVNDIAPVAALRGPIGANVGNTIVLDGTESDDANGETLVFQWKQQSGPEVKLTDTTPGKVSFVPEKPGLYRFSLVVEEDQSAPDGLRSQPATIEVAVHDPAGGQPGVYLPHAVVQAPSLAVVGATVLLDGSRSRDLKLERTGESLSYQWSLIEAPDRTVLRNETGQKAQLIAAQRGLVKVGLVVNNGTHQSRLTTVSVFFQEKDEARLPIASPKAVYAFLDQWSPLDGSQSRDVSGKQLTFRWSQFVQGGGVPTVLQDARSARPSFFALCSSPYRFLLRVQSDGPESVPVPVTIWVNQKGNQPPIADAGSDKVDKSSVMAGQSTSLDGTKSKDPDASPKQALLYRWEQVSGFPVSLHGSDTATPSFVPVTYGILRFSLQVHDGVAWSQPSYLNVVAHDQTNHVPHANAGPNQKVLLGQDVILDGSKSTDADPKDSLTYHWRLLQPQGKDVTLNLLDPKHPSFTAKDPGIARYVFGLVVDDGKVASLEQTVEIEVLDANKPPVAVIEAPKEVYVDTDLILDGTKSNDPDDDKLIYEWKQVGGEQIPLKDTDQGTLNVRFVQPGVYRFQLIVSDGIVASAPDEVILDVKERDAGANGCGCQSGASFPIPSLWLLLIVLLGLCVQRRMHKRRI
jgi:hypothetical protein